MIETLEIGEVAQRTGLSHRALRFHEARGLVKPLRVTGGHRVYGPGELARLNAVAALKRAGGSASPRSAGRWAAGGPISARWSVRRSSTSIASSTSSPPRADCSSPFSPASIVASRSTSRRFAR